MTARSRTPDPSARPTRLTHPYQHQYQYPSTSSPQALRKAQKAPCPSRRRESTCSRQKEAHLRITIVGGTNRNIIMHGGVEMRWSMSFLAARPHPHHRPHHRRPHLPHRCLHRLLLHHHPSPTPSPPRPSPPRPSPPEPSPPTPSPNCWRANANAPIVRLLLEAKTNKGVSPLAAPVAVLARPRPFFFTPSSSQHS